MKISIQKFFFALFLIMEISSMAVMAAITTAQPVINFDSHMLIKPKVTISFTIARRRDCEGFGICNASVSLTEGRLNSANGTITIDETNRNVLIIEIPKATGISAATYDKYFRGETFLMEDETVLPSEIVKGLGLSGTKTLLAGRHPVREAAGILSVVIPVR